METQVPAMIVIHGADGATAKRVNGQYDLHASCHKDKPCWQKQGDDKWILWWGDGWKVTDTGSKESGDQKSWLWCRENVSFPTLVTAWKVIDRGKWVSQAVRVEKVPLVVEHGHVVYDSCDGTLPEASEDEPGCYVDFAEVDDEYYTTGEPDQAEEDSALVDALGDATIDPALHGEPEAEDDSVVVEALGGTIVDHALLGELEAEEDSAVVEALGDATVDLTLHGEAEVDDEYLAGEADQDGCVGRFAFISILFGQKVGYCIDALVLGEALRAHGTKYSYILLITEDVPAEWQTVLSKVGWELRLVEYINGDHLYIGGRFEGVFTKLHALSLVEFDKIVLLDLDLLVRTSIDELFQRPTPSAMRRHASADFIDGELISSASFIKGGGVLVSGINAGVMVMTPSLDEFRQMLDQIQQENPPEHLKSGMPEQDFLTRFYKDSWHHLSVRYNFQPHQIAFTDRRGLEQCSRLTLDYSDVSIVHFSASLKPRDLLINTTYQGMNEMKYAEEVLLSQYWAGVNSDRRKDFSRLDPRAIEAQLRVATRASTGEWFSHWKALMERFPELMFLVDTAEVCTEVSNEKKRKRTGGHFHNRNRSRSRFRERRRWA